MKYGLGDPNDSTVMLWRSCSRAFTRPGDRRRKCPGKNEHSRPTGCFRGPQVLAQGIDDRARQMSGEGDQHFAPDIYAVG